MNLFQQLTKALASLHIQPNLQYHHHQNGDLSFTKCRLSARHALCNISNPYNKTAISYILQVET